MGEINEPTTQEAVKNVNKNVDTTKNLTPFTSEYQPSPEAKSKGWERRRQAQRMMDKIMEYMNMTQREFMELLNDIKFNPDKHTVLDVMLYKYATKAFNGEKFMLDFINRSLSYAPQDIDLKSGGKEINMLTAPTEVLLQYAKDHGLKLPDSTGDNKS